MVEYEPQGANSNTENPAKKLSESPLSKLQKTIKGFQQLNKCLVVVQRPRLQVPNAEGPGSSRGEGATLAAVLRFLTAVVSLVAECGLEGSPGSRSQAQ